MATCRQKSVKKDATTPRNPTDPVVLDYGRLFGSAICPNAKTDHPAVTHIDHDNSYTVNNPIGNGTLFYGYEIYSTMENVSLVDKFGMRVEVPYRSNSVIGHANKAVITLRYMMSDLPVKDIAAQEIIIDLDTLTTDEYKCVYIKEIDAVVGITSYLEMHAVVHPSMVDQYSALFSDIMDAQDIVPPGSGFEISININRKAPQEYQHDVLYVDLPFASEPIAVIPATLPTKNDEAEMSIRFYYKFPVIEDGEPTGEYKHHVIFSEKVEVPAADEVVDISFKSDKLKMFISPSMKRADRAAKLYWADYEENNYTLDEYEEGIRTVKAELMRKLEASEQLRKEAEKQFKQKEAMLKNDIEMKDIQINQFKVRAQTEAETRKEEYDRWQQEMKVIQERERTKQQVNKSTSEAWKTGITIASVVVSLASTVAAFVAVNNNSK